ncbi:MAG: sugar phosphate isomerase/epimerase family protein [Nitrososphaerota archaeon]
MAKYTLACGTWPYMFPPYAARPYTLEEVFKMLSELRFDGVELSGFKPHAHPDLYPTKKERSDLKSLVEAYGLEICGYAADMGGYAIASNYEEERRMYERMFKINLDFCRDLDIRIMRVDTVSGPKGIPGVPWNVAMERVIDMFKKCAKLAEDAGIILVWEFEPGFMFNKPSEIIKIVKEVNHPNFKLMVDTCHAHCCGIGLNQPHPLEIIDVPLSKIAAEFIRRLKGYIGHVHLIDSDNTLNPHNTSTHAPFGLGVIDFDEVMKALDEVGYSGWLTLDLCFWPQAWEATRDCKNFLDRLVEKYG